MSGLCPTCDGIGIVPANPLDDVTNPATTQPCPACGPVATPITTFRQRSTDQCLDDPKRLCSRCRRIKPVGKFRVRAEDGSRHTICMSCSNDTGTGKRDGLSKAQMAARLPCGLCLCGCPLGAHAGLWRCLVCGCGEFMERGT